MSPAPWAATARRWTALRNANGMAPKSRFFIQDITPGSEQLRLSSLRSGTHVHNRVQCRRPAPYQQLGRGRQFLQLHVHERRPVHVGAQRLPGPLRERQRRLRARAPSAIPASAKNVVSVGRGTENGTGAENMASFSSNGPTADGRIKPTITAPGTVH